MKPESCFLFCLWFRLTWLGGKKDQRNTSLCSTTNKDCMWFQVPETDQRLYSSCYVRIVFKTFSSRLLYVSISRVRVFVFKSLKKTSKTERCGTLVFLCTFSKVPRSKIRTNCSMLQLTHISLGMCVMNVNSISVPCISLSLFLCLERSPRLYLPLSFLITHKLLSVLSVFHQPDTNWPSTNTYLFEQPPPTLPETDSPEPEPYTLAISFHLCIRQGVSLASFSKGRLLLLVLDELSSEGAAEDQVVKWARWLFSKCNDAFQHFTSWMSSVFHPQLDQHFSGYDILSKLLLHGGWLLEIL